ncbi:hypothetical protein C1645_815928 [Glomus cerebriforme]|uniref:HAT C-terminal dimerisation domain-containing protein n=1 Tax=Glomus cerebriforme TaxID=658196 RepID=A0A397TFG5_9GLOM|nr:hypothetical protein C1645_815928 [Glomus cerebriforme]
MPNNKKNTRLPEKQKLQTKNNNTKSFSEVWNYYEKDTQRNNGHYEAICSYCKIKWLRRKPQKMEAHLANDCLQCPEEISKYWSLDGWTTPKMESIYNYIVTTDTRMEYLIGLRDYSSDSHTIVTDNASNCRAARQNIQQTYPHIWDILTEHANSITSNDIAALMEDGSFFFICQFESKLAPFNLSFISNLEFPKLWWKSIKSQLQHLAELACQIFSINPTQVNCERNFSTLSWILGEKISLNKLEAIAKIQSYYMNNIQKELSYIGNKQATLIGKNFTEKKLRESTNITSINSIISLKVENEIANIGGNNSLSESFFSIELAIGKIVNLTININNNNEERGSDTTPA